MTNYKAKTNINIKKSIASVITSILFTYLINNKKNDVNRSKKSKIHTFKKFYSFLNGICSLVFTKKATAEFKMEPDDFVIEKSIIIDL